MGIDSGNFWHHRTSQFVSTHTKLCSCRQDLGRKGSLGGDGPTGFRQLKGRFVKPDDLLVNINFFWMIISSFSMNESNLWRVTIYLDSKFLSKISAGEIRFFRWLRAAENFHFLLVTWTAQAWHSCGFWRPPLCVRAIPGGDQVRDRHQIAGWLDKNQGLIPTYTSYQPANSLRTNSIGGDSVNHSYWWICWDSW